MVPQQDVAPFLLYTPPRRLSVPSKDCTHPFKGLVAPYSQLRCSQRGEEQRKPLQPHDTLDPRSFVSVVPETHSTCLVLRLRRRPEASFFPPPVKGFPSPKHPKQMFRSTGAMFRATSAQLAQLALATKHLFRFPAAVFRSPKCWENPCGCLCVWLHCSGNPLMLCSEVGVMYHL